MEYIQATRQLKQHRLYKEYKELTHQYYLHSIRQEEKTNNYLKNKSLLNKTTGEVYTLSYDFETAQKKAKNETIQKIIHIEKIARENGLKPLFLTFTLPSRFFAFISVGKNKNNRLYVDVNKNFAYRNISNAIRAGYSHLNHLFRSFYRQIKRYTFGNLIKYIKVYEPHKNGHQIHLHALFFIHPNDMEKVILYFQKFIKKYDVGRTDFQTNIISNINRVGSYISKYIYKNATNDTDKYFIRFLDGWKKTNKIRMISTSQVNINMFLYKKLYTSLPKEIKKEMLCISSYKEQTLLTTLIERTEFNERTIEGNTSFGTTKTIHTKSDFIIKYDKVKTKQLTNVTSIRKEKNVQRVYREDELYRKDNFVEEKFFPCSEPNKYSYLGYLTHKEVYEDIVQRSTIKNITIYYKNKLLYKQGDFTLIQD